MPYHNVDELRRAATGRWKEILVSVGIPASILDGRNHPCPKCGGRDRFATFLDFDDRGAVHCRHCFTRGSVIPPSDGISTLRWWTNSSFPESLQLLADALGVGTNLSSTFATASNRSRSVPITDHAALASEDGIARDVIDGHTDCARDAYHRMDDATRRRLARLILVSEHALDSLRVGITSDNRCSTWPMRNGKGDMIGVRILGLPWTDARGAKWSRRGSYSGIFFRPRSALRVQADRDVPGTLFVTEGASDTAAAISLGLWAVGRASCNASTFFVDQYIHRHQPSKLVIVADNDTPGRTGAKRLAKSLCNDLPRSLGGVEIVVPPETSMDLRDWVREGASQIDLHGAKPIESYTFAQQLQIDFGS